MEKTIKSFSTIENSFSRLKIITVASIVMSGVIAITCIISYMSFCEKQREKIYVLDQGKSLLLALQTDKVSNRPIEITDHITGFHELFFTLAPNVESIEHNINAALNLADRRAYEYYNDLQSEGYYSRLITASMSQSVVVDSVNVNYNHYPYTATTYSTMYIIRSNAVTTRKLITSCTVRDIARSNSNPHGLLIEKFEVLDNSTIRENKR